MGKRSLEHTQRAEEVQIGQDMYSPITVVFYHHMIQYVGWS